MKTKTSREKELSKMIALRLAGVVFIGGFTFVNSGGAALAAEADATTEIITGSEETSNNAVTVNDGSYTVNGETEEYSGTLDIIRGGGDETGIGNASGNNVVVSNGNVGVVVGGISTSGNAAENRITVQDGTINGVAGGITIYTEGSNVSAGDVKNNTVTINGGNINYVSGGEVGYVYEIDGGSSTPDVTQAAFSQGGNVSGNTVTVNGGTISGGVSGGAALTGSADNNTVAINGGTVSGQVIAGEVRYPTANSSVTGNTITISGYPNLTNAYLKGGVSGGSDVATGNTLNIVNTKGITAQNISGFENLNVYMPANVQSGDTILTLTDGSGTNLSGMNVVANVRGGDDVSINVGDYFNIVSNASGVTVDGSTNIRNYIMEGSTLRHNIVTSSDGSNLIATIASPEVVSAASIIPMPALVTPLIVPEPRLPDPLGWDYDTSEYATRDGLYVPQEDKAEAKDEKPVAMVIAPFFDISGSSIREKTGHGSYIDVDSVNMDAGVSFGRDNKHGRLVWAPIVDYGNGDYDTYLSDGTKGSGNAKFWAGGLIARQTSKNGFYYEGSFRAGRTDVDFLSNDFENTGAPGAPLTFNASATIMTGHVRLGKLMQIGHSDTLHVYGVYTHTHQGSMDAYSSAGDHYRFSSIDNGRFRVGMRLTRQMTPNQRFYSGLAYQYALNGDAVATVKQVHELPKAGQNGSSGMLELGWQLKPSANTPWMLDLSATGWIGMQKGVSCQLRCKREF